MLNIGKHVYNGERSMEKPDKLEVWDEAKLLLLFPEHVLVNTEDEHYKFWATEKTLKGYKTYWGRIGKKIQSKEFELYHVDYDISKKLKNKLKKGYKEL